MRLLSAILLALVFASCAPAKHEPESGITLTLYHWMEKDRALWEEQIIRPFEAAHPGIHVVLETSPYALYVAKSLTSIASGSRFADLMFAEDWFGQELIRKKYCRNLMPYVRRDLALGDFNTETFTEWRGTAQQEGDLFGFPACLGLTVLFYNKDMFDAAGLHYPDTSWTYDDLITVGRKLTVDQNGDGIPDRWGLSFDVHYTGLETVIYSFNGRTLTGDSRRCDLNNPATLSALRFIRGLFLENRIASKSTSFINPWESFVGGRSAMILIGSLGSLNLVGSSMRWEMTCPPKGPDGLRKSRRFTMAFMIPSNSPHPDEAWELLKWILMKSPPDKLNDQYMGMMPTYKPFTRSELWLNAEPLYDRRMLVDLEEKSSFPLFTPAWQEWRDNNLTPELLMMIQGSKSVEQTARDAERRINAVLTRVEQE